MTTAPVPESVRVTKLRIKVLATARPQYQVAALAGIHPSTFSRYVKGDAPILDKHLIALCDLFGCEPEDVMGWEEVNGFYQ
jgi:transcriptional regulator with XRE-family HTH domain